MALEFHNAIANMFRKGVMFWEIILSGFEIMPTKSCATFFAPLDIRISSLLLPVSDSAKVAMCTKLKKWSKHL